MQEMRIRTITRPSRTRTIRGRKYHAVAVKRETREFIVYSPAAVKLPSNRKDKMGKNKDKTAEVTDDELKELENLEDLDAEEPDEDKPAKKDKKGKKAGKGNKKGTTEDADEAPKKKTRSTGAEPGKSRAAANGKVGTAEIAAAGQTDARTLRMVLRKYEVEKNPESGRYEWDSMKDPTVKKILKWLKDGEAEAVKQEGLQRLKDSKDAKAKTDEGDAGAKKDKKKDKAGKKGKKNKS